MTVFSFHPVKHITTGEGGMVTTNNTDLAKQLKLFRNHGIDSEPRQRQAAGQWYYEMVQLGYNYRLADIGCALGLSQLKKLPNNIVRRREIAARYTEGFSDIAIIITPVVRPDVNPAWHLYPIRLDLKDFRVGRSEIFLNLRAEGLGVNVHYIPVPLHPYYRERLGCADGEYPIAERAYEELLSLPIFHGMSDQDITDTIEAVRKVLQKHTVTRARL
jgi:perosamine synthetase